MYILQFNMNQSFLCIFNNLTRTNSVCLPVQGPDTEVSHSKSTFSLPANHSRPLLNCLDLDQPLEREALLDIVREVELVKSW